jgi:DNA-directed RNA polymerase specialized sigma24 family protein
MVPERRSMTIKTEPARRDAVGTYSLEGIYAAEIRRLVSFGTVLTGDASAGEDLAHDAFVQLVRRVNRDPGYLHGPAWPLLRKVIVRLALQRRRTYARELLRLARAWQPAPESVWEPDLSLLDWSAALQTLPPRNCDPVLRRRSKHGGRRNGAQVFSAHCREPTSPRTDATGGCPATVKGR